MRSVAASYSRPQNVPPWYFSSIGFFGWPASADSTWAACGSESSFRFLAKPEGVRIVIPGALVVRDTVDDLVAHLRMFEADADELRDIARTDPDREAPAVDRMGSVIADANAEKPDAVLVGIKAGERLAERF